jgi:lipopolysaccharide export system permease protein
MSARPLRFGGRLDRYVARLFGLSYLTAFFLVVGLFLIIDMATNLDDYLKPDRDGVTASSGEVAHYYLLQLPFLYLQMSPFVTLVAGLFAGAKLSRHNEIVGVLNAGISIRRMLLPIFLVAGVLSAGMFGLREWATQELGARRDAVLDSLLERRPAQIFEDFWVTDHLGRYLRIREYLPGSPERPQPEIRGLTYQFRTGAASTSLKADRALPIEPYEEGRWRLEGAYRLDMDRDLKRTSYPRVLEGIHFTPADVELAFRAKEHPLDLSFTQLLRILERNPSSAAMYQTLLHGHMSFPLAGLVLLAVGLPFVTSQRRGRKAVERVAVGFLLCVVYFGVDFVTRTLGMQGNLGPLHSAWLPILLFGSLGAVLYASTPS